MDVTHLVLEEGQGIVCKCVMEEWVCPKLQVRPLAGQMKETRLEFDYDHNDPEIMALRSHGLALTRKPQEPEAGRILSSPAQEDSLTSPMPPSYRCSRLSEPQTIVLLASHHSHPYSDSIGSSK